MDRDSPSGRRSGRGDGVALVRSLVPTDEQFRRGRYIYALGILFVLAAVGHATLKVAGGGSHWEAILDLLLIALPGLLLLYVATWLSSTEFDTDLYPRIALWCLGGVSVMLVFVVLRAVHPGVQVNWTFGTGAIAMSLGSIAGLAIGLHEASARTREEELDRQTEALRRTQQDLEDRNEELQETREQLRETVAELEASNDRLERFASAASHDLKEPLRMVTSYLQLLDDRHADDLDDEAAEFVDFAQDGAVRMQTMIEDLLQYSRVETGTDSHEPIDLDAVVEDVRTDLRVRIEESDAKITAEGLPRVEGDASQLRQLFQNLLSNAIEYAGDEPPRVHVSAEERGGEHEISVTDEGVGIDLEERERIFELFERLHSHEEQSGTGIGLAICDRIVDHHDGEIWVDGDCADGATFCFTVPAVEEQAVAPTPPTSSSRQPSTSE